jgi:hypothetical protein
MFFQEPSEPNDGAAFAAYLGNMDDCDTSALTINGYLAGNADQDFYAVDVTDAVSCLMSGAFQVDTGGVTATACLELRCVSGTLDLECLDGSTPTTGSGVARCCKTGSNPQFTLSHNCSGTVAMPDDVRVVASLSGADLLAECAVYSAVLGF